MAQNPNDITPNTQPPQPGTPGAPQPTKPTPSTQPSEQRFPATKRQGLETDLDSSNWRVIALGVYLLLFFVIAVYFLSKLVSAESEPKRINCLLDRDRAVSTNPNSNANSNANSEANSNSNTTANFDCYKLEDPDEAPTPSPTASPTPTTSPSPTPSVTPTPTATLTPTPTPTPTPGGTGGTEGGNSGGSRNPTNSNSTGGNTNAAGNANSQAKPTPSRQQFARVTIPPIVYVEAGVVYRGALSADAYVFWVVFFSGMLGALIRAATSFLRHMGLNDFAFRWAWFYILLPFVGAGLSIVIYLVVRGGFYSSSFGEGLTLNLFSFGAFAALTGLFSENAMEKLRQVAVTLLSEVPPKVVPKDEKKDNKGSN
ncbi:MAG TPA: hypothetical protein VF596_17480 [Pyrinomonadaceae bacterium]|jgi:hypothetical protein